MVAKLALVLIAVVVIVALATAAAFWYFNQESERQHEKDLKQMEHTEKVMGIAEEESGIDGELEREKNN